MRRRDFIVSIGAEQRGHLWRGRSSATGCGALAF